MQLIVDFEQLGKRNLNIIIKQLMSIPRSYYNLQIETVNN